MFISLSMLRDCDFNGLIIVSEGVDSEFEGSMTYYGGDNQNNLVTVQKEFTKGRNPQFTLSDKWRKKDNFLELFLKVGMAPDDSVIFFNLDSTRQLVFINPMVDDSVDFKAKKSAHFWNIDNWYATKDAVYYLLTTENFERFAEEI